MLGLVQYKTTAIGCLCALLRNNGRFISGADWRIKPAWIKKNDLGGTWTHIRALKARCPSQLDDKAYNEVKNKM